MPAFFTKDKDIFFPSYIESEGTQMNNPHYHHSYELYLLVKGKRTYLINDRLYEISEGDIVLIPPMSLHKTMGPHNYHRYVINFSGQFLNSYFTKEAQDKLLKCFTLRCIHLSGNVLDNAIQLFKKTIECYEKKDGMAFAYLFNILLILAEYIDNSEPVKPLSSETNNAILNIIEYIDNHYRRINSISEIAEQNFVTKHHLCRMFKKATGVTLINYLNSVKIHKACLLLDKSNKNITEIAYETGFNSSMYFGRIFKSFMGVTPTEYRAKGK